MHCRIPDLLKTQYLFQKLVELLLHGHAAIPSESNPVAKTFELEEYTPLKRKYSKIKIYTKKTSAMSKHKKPSNKDLKDRRKAERDQRY